MITYKEISFHRQINISLDQRIEYISFCCSRELELKEKRKRKRSYNELGYYRNFDMIF